MPTPIILQKTSRSTVKTSDGKDVAAAFDIPTGKLMIKTAASMPWGDDAALAAIQSSGGQYIADSDEWYRGVWEPAPDEIASSF